MTAEFFLLSVIVAGRRAVGQLLMINGLGPAGFGAAPPAWREL